VNFKRLVIISGSILLGLTIGSIWLFSGPPKLTQAASFNVCPAGPPTCDFSTIQAAVDAATSGDTITINSGTYIENVVIVGKTLTIQGAGEDITIVDGNESGSVFAISENADLSISDMTITNGTGTRIGSPSYGGGIYIVQSSLNLKNCIVENTYVTGGAGGLEATASILNIDDCIFRMNRGNKGGAITLHYGEAIIKNNLIETNSCSDGGAIYMMNYSHATIINNVIYGECPAGIGLGAGAEAIITNNTILNNQHGIATNTYDQRFGTGTATIKNNILWGNLDDLVNLTATYSNIEDGDSGAGNISEDPMFVDPANNDYHLQIDSPCVDAGTNDGAPNIDYELDSRPVDGNGDGVATVDIGADETHQLPNHDIETLLILAPVSDLTRGEPISPRVRIRNIGGSNESGFSVFSEVMQGNSVVYSDTTVVSGLATFEATEITFSEWLPQTVGSHNIEFRTQLESDVNPGNDTKTGTFNVETQTFIPVTFCNFCTDFFDDFSDPTNGWIIQDDEFERTEYLNGEYRVLTKQSGYFYTFLAPRGSRDNYVVEVDVRWAFETAHSYGIVFGVLPDYSQYYLFDMNTDYRQFRVLRKGSGGFYQVVPTTYSPAINPGISSNHLKVIRDGAFIRLEVNGTPLGNWWDSNITGSTYVGILSWPYEDKPISDARFDNFSLRCLPNSGTVTMDGGGNSNNSLDLYLLVENQVVINDDESWWLPIEDD